MRYSPGTCGTNSSFCRVRVLKICMVNSPFCGRQKPQNKPPPERCTKHSSEGGFLSKSRFHFCLSLKAGNGGAPHGDTSRRGSRRVLSGRTLRGSLQTGFQPVACSLCADDMRRYSARINAFILLPLYYSGAAQGSQGGTGKDSECAERSGAQLKSSCLTRDTGSLPAVLLPALPALPWAVQRPAGGRECPASAT